MKHLSLTLKMTTAQVAETSVTVNYRPIRGLRWPEDRASPTYVRHASPTYEITPGPFTVLSSVCMWANLA